MYKLEKLVENDFPSVWKIMEESFPVDERRTMENQKKLFLEEKYELLGCKKEGKMLSFFAVWQFEDFLFIEHFAVDKEARNGGLGAVMLSNLQKMNNKKIILEVEPPADELTKRRVAFYERNGFCLNDYFYMQPAMDEDTKPIPLKIMSYPKELSRNEFEAVREELYRSVYRQNENTIMHTGNETKM